MTNEQENTINDLAKELYLISANHGFHANDNKISNAEYWAIRCENLHGEVSELWEVYRKNKLNEKCDKDCDLTYGEEELADIFIRCLDTAFAKGINIGRAIRIKSEYNKTRPFMHGKLC